MSGLARACLLAVAAVAALLLLPDSAQAQQRRRPWFFVYDWGGEVGIETRYTMDARNASDVEKVEEREWILGQDVTIRGDGWVYHPALLQFTAEVGALFEQTDISTDPSGGDTDVDGNNLNFNLTSTMFPYKAYPTTFFANQGRTRVNSPLTPSRTVDLLRYGAGLHLRELTLGSLEIPTRLSYRHHESETSSTGRSAGQDRVRDEFRIFLDNQTESMRNRLDYRWDTVESTSGDITNEVTRQDLRFLQQLDMQNSTLTSRITARDEADTRDFQAFNLGEVLSVTHTENLTSNYNYAFNWQDADTSTQRSHIGSAGLAHQLYESLSSSISAGGSTASFDTGDVTTWSAIGGLNYTKQIPGGRFGLRFSPGYAWQDEDTEPGLRSVFGEDQTVTLTQDVVLDNFLIVRDTIQVYEPVTGFVFTEGIDYDIVDLGVSTAIRIVPGGDLDPAVPPLVQTFAVNYDFVSNPPRTFSTRTMTYGGSLNLLDHYSWDVSYAQVDQDLIDGLEADPTLSDSRRLLARFDARFENSLTHAEFERVREEITPRKRWAVSQNLNFRPTPSSSLGFTAYYSSDEITDVDRLTVAYGAAANATAVLPFRVLGHFSLLARQLDQEEQDTFGYGFNLSLNYRYGRLTFELMNDFTWRKTDTTSRQFQSTIRDRYNSTFFKVTREF